MKKVSILIPTYNRANLLDECLQSILNQTYKNIEVVIYDDGSTDNTYEIIDRYRFSKLDKRIVYCTNHNNHGVGFARNFLMDIAIGDYFVWQDSDDIATPDRVEKLVEAIDQQNVDVLFSAMYFFPHPNMNRRTLSTIDISKYTDREGLYRNMNFATAIFKKELKEFKFDESLKRKEDVKWITAIIESGKKIGYIDEALYFCRKHEGRLTEARE